MIRAYQGSQQQQQLCCRKAICVKQGSQQCPNRFESHYACPTAARWMTRRDATPPTCLQLLLQWAGAPSGQSYPATTQQSLQGASGFKLDSAHSIRKDDSSLPLPPCQQQVLQQAQSVLKACPGLPAFCPRSGNALHAQQVTYLRPGGPSNGQMAQQKKAVDQYIAGPGFHKRLSQLQQLPDKQGILISAGKSHHVGNTAIILHVSPSGSLGWCKAASTHPAPTQTFDPSSTQSLGMQDFLAYFL
jgi:hypothetical protein